MTKFHCDVCGSDGHDSGICEDQPVRVSCIHMPGCDCAAIKARLVAAEAKIAAVEALADDWTDDHRILMEAGAIYDLGNGKRACEVWYEKPNRNKWHGDQLRAALEQTP